jgi:hypothetical protein
VEHQGILLNSDALKTFWPQQLELNPQGTSAFSPGAATETGAAVGGLVGVAVPPIVISDTLRYVGAAPPLAVSSPNAVVKVPAARIAAPATSAARVFLDCCMNMSPHFL